jgi:glycosyl transferase, family 25
VRICVINLARSVERRASIERQLRGLAMPFSLYEAVDGSNLDVGRIPDYNRQRRLRSWGTDLTHGEIGAYLSHYNVMEAASRATESHTLVLEDDIALPSDVAEILSFIDGLDESYELIRLHGGRVPRNLKWQQITAGRRLVRLLGVASAASAYVVSRVGAAKFVAHGKPILRQIDVELDRYWDHGLRMFAVLPYPIRILPGFDSDIGSRINAWELPGMRHWRLKAKLWKFSDSIRKRTKNIGVRFDTICSHFPGRATS